MNHHDGPPRLRESPEWAGTLGALASEEVDAAWLARGRIAQRRRLAASTVASTLTATTSAWARWGLTLSKLVGGSLVAVVGVTGYLGFASAPPSRPPTPLTPTSLAPSSLTPTQPPAPTLEPPTLEPPTHGMPARSASVELTAAPSPAASLSGRASPRSDLPTQLALFEAARSAARAGKPELALQRLAELETRFPNTPLRAELELARTDYLTRAGRLAEATESTEQLAQSGTHSGRRGQIYHLLGDLRRRQGDCRGAKAAYELALDAGVSPAEATQIQRAMRLCAGP